jgi:SpoVK/Ycf46/Vps4 family AAA+-type ATPase
MQIEPRATELQEGLADVFLAQGKNSYALLLTEKLVDGDPTPSQLLLHARVLQKSGNQNEARKFYRQAVQASPLLEDPELTRLFNLNSRDFVPESDLDDKEPYAEPIGGFAPEISSFDVEKPKISFAHVGGMETVKESIRMKIIYPLQNKEMFAAYGKKIGGGVLLYGPPGCGKTLLARGTAGEIRANFLSIGLHDILDMYIGQSEKQLHRIFDEARINTPCVLFFDEVDALAAKRSDMRQSAGRHIINQFLSELDGATGDNDGILILAATNAPWHVDTAFRRPGRFDRIIFVPPPDAKAREAIWKIHLTGKPVDAIDYAKLAASSKGFSGADIAAAVDACIEETLSEAMKTGRPIPLSTAALLKVIKRTKPTTTEWFASAKNYATYANESGAYDDIIEYLKTRHD